MGVRVEKERRIADTLSNLSDEIRELMWDKKSCIACLWYLKEARKLYEKCRNEFDSDRTI